jgi:hypothetical protein
MGEFAEARTDVVIFGGGVAGLWLLNRLRATGYSAILLEADRLGAGQTIAAQGIIHGGLKYALDLTLGEAARAIADMPAVWRRCLAGTGEIDLRAVKVSADHCHFWLPTGLLAQATGFFASKTVKSKAEKLDPVNWPAALIGQPGVGAVYALDEPVLDLPSLLATLAAPHTDRIRHIDWPGGVEFDFDADERLCAVRLRRRDNCPIRLAARSFVFTAGGGNEAAIAKLRTAGIATQRRPLRMAMLKGMRHHLFAHCFDVSDKPRVTITSHIASDGSIVWYVGGELAESGATILPEKLIASARHELSVLLPNLDLSQVKVAAFVIDRAEPHQRFGRRPDRPVVVAKGAALIAWPTKLAFAPALAAEIIRHLGRERTIPGEDDLAAFADWPHPGFAVPPWETAEWS